MTKLRQKLQISHLDIIHALPQLLVQSCNLVWLVTQCSSSGKFVEELLGASQWMHHPTASFCWFCVPFFLLGEEFDSQKRSKRQLISSQKSTLPIRVIIIMILSSALAQKIRGLFQKSLFSALCSIMVSRWFVPLIVVC